MSTGGPPENETDTAVESSLDQPGSWGEAALAGLPHLLFALAMIFGPRLAAQVGSLRIRVLEVLFVALVAAALAAAWCRNWPLWSAPWIGYGTLVAFGAGLEAAQQLARQTQGVGAAVTAVTLAGLALFVGCLVWFVLRSLVGALLVALPVAGMGYWFLVLDEIRGGAPEDFLFLLTGAIIAGVTALEVRHNRPAGAAGLALAATLAVNLLLAWGKFTYPSYLGPTYTAPDPTPANILAGGLRMLAVPLVLTTPVWLSAFAFWLARVTGRTPQRP